MDERSFRLIKYDEDKDIIKSYFCFLTTLFTVFVEDHRKPNPNLSLTNLSLEKNNSKNSDGEKLFKKFDLNKLVDNFEKLIILSADIFNSSTNYTGSSSSVAASRSNHTSKSLLVELKIMKIIESEARKNKEWNFLMKSLKFKYANKTDCCFPNDEIQLNGEDFI